jgi:UDP-2,3-diacylglucosamine pyrophosphatase LpxH
MKRKPEIVILSDVHLGRRSCCAKELLEYLNSIDPKTLILNGDFIDVPQSKQLYFPKLHLEVVHTIIDISKRGSRVYYITGNHDDPLRRFSDFSTGHVHLRSKLVFHLSGKKYWIFHGDVFDLLHRRSIWLARLGGKGYDWLLRINRIVNQWSRRLGKPRISFSERLQQQKQKAAQMIEQFETTALQLAAEQGYDYVICGHTHCPKMRVKPFPSGEVTYLNSGDWTEHLTALEYKGGNWTIYRHDKQEHPLPTPEKRDPEGTADELSDQLKEIIFKQVLQPTQKKMPSKY